MVDPHITVAAADAAVMALCDENLCPREIFDVEEDYANSYSARLSTSEIYLLFTFIYPSDFARWLLALKLFLCFIKSLHLLLSVPEPLRVKG